MVSRQVHRLISHSHWDESMLAMYMFLRSVWIFENTLLLNYMDLAMLVWEETGRSLP